MKTLAVIQRKVVMLKYEYQITDILDNQTLSLAHSLHRMDTKKSERA